jgi:hypothetical protein
MKRFTLTIVALAWVISGCAVGNQYAYHGVTPELNARTSKKVAVATHDQRSYIQNGEKQPDFVGLQRGGYGNPFKVTTASGRPLAEDMTTAIVNSLQSKGIHCVPVFVGPADPESSVTSAMKKSAAQRHLLLTLTQWRSDCYSNVALAYDAQLKVLDASGTLLAQKRINGNDNLGGNAWNPPAHAKAAVPKALKEKLELLLNDQAIQDALK